MLMGGACVSLHAHVFMSACAFVCIHGGRSAAVSSLTLEDLGSGLWRREVEH